MCVDLCHCALDSAGRGGACASVRCSSLPARSLLRIHIADVRPACSACREAPHHPGAPWDSQTLWGVTTCLALRSASAVRHDSVEVVHGDISSSRPATSSSQASSAPQPPPLPPTPVHSAPTHTDETDLVPRMAAMQRVPTESVQRVQRTGRVYDVDEEDGFTFQTCVAGFSTSPPSLTPAPTSSHASCCETHAPHPRILFRWLTVWTSLSVNRDGTSTSARTENPLAYGVGVGEDVSGDGRAHIASFAYVVLLSSSLPRSSLERLRSSARSAQLRRRS
jgi:hypothetical protein